MPTQTVPAKSVAALPESLPDAMPYPLTDNGKLVEMIADVLDIPEDEDRETLYQVELSPIEYFQREYAKLGIEPYVWCKELEEFYRDTNVYLTGGIVWNRKAYKTMIREWIATYLANHRIGPQRILTVGDGVGFDSLYLSQYGHKVTYSELSEKCIRFARQLFNLADEPVEMLDNLSDIEEAGYDAIPFDNKEQLRIQFYLTGNAEVLVDDVQLYDLRFNEGLRGALVKRIYGAKLALEQGQVADCLQIVDEYWSRYLVEYVPPLETNTATVAKQPSPSETADDQEESKGIRDRFKDWVPKIWR